MHTVPWPYPDILIRCGSRVGLSLLSLPSPRDDQGCDWFFNSQLRQLTYLGKYKWMSTSRACGQKPPFPLESQTFVLCNNEEMRVQLCVMGKWVGCEIRLPGFKSQLQHLLAKRRRAGLFLSKAQPPQLYNKAIIGPASKDRKFYKG